MVFPYKILQTQDFRRGKKAAGYAKMLNRRRARLLRDALTRGWIKYGAPQELLAGPWRGIASQIPVKPFEMRGVIKGHLVPTGPMAGPGINE